MIIGLEGFGSVWSVRAGLSPERTAYYNTTGIITGGKLRHRSRVFGQVRFNAVGGFNPNHVERNIGRVFETECRPEQGHRSFLVHHLLDRPLVPDYHLFALASDYTGGLKVDCGGWKSDGVVLISMSQVDEQQEAMLLMPVHSWIRGGLGRFASEPCADRPWRAFLRLMR